MFLAVALALGGGARHDAEAQPGFVLRHGTRVALTFGALATLAVMAGPGTPLYQRNVQLLRVGVKIHFVTGAPLIYAALQTLVLSDASRLTDARGLAKEIGLDETRIVAGSNPDMPIYRVWGGPATLYGRSWTPVDPRTLGTSYRNLAGLPATNEGTKLSQAVIVVHTGITYRPALAIPSAGTAGGLPEIVIPDPQSQLRILSTEDVNPPF